MGMGMGMGMGINDMFISTITENPDGSAKPV